MSRCFPYLRPIYKREDASLIGSIKLQWGNTKQRKQASRKVTEKQNKKRSREEHDNLDSLQHKNKKRMTDNNIEFNESCCYASKEYTDHLERSDLSEEHYPPALVVNKCNSSSIQNNNKNNAVQDSGSDKQRPGFVIRIKLPLKKHLEVQPHLKELQPELAKTDPGCSFKLTKSSKPPALLNDSASSYSQANKTCKPQSLLTEPAPRRSSDVNKLSEVQIFSTEPSPCCSTQTTKTTFLTESTSVYCSQIPNSYNSKSILTESALRTEEVPSAKQPFSARAEPNFPSPVAKVPIYQESIVEANHRKSSHRRSNGRSFSRRSERQLFRDLIINWKPPSIEPIASDEGELDWLFASKKPQGAKPNAQIFEAGVSHHGTHLSSSASSLQPRATYLPEFGMYQLPYVIPF
ncbi:uncharacterized protein LOC110019427 isoform X2 [Phalaenopsis equestris]|uniref:uncharacterized protein LOC110019427 isoform X2 n=1 Tax=Phalaenopsis equestris TaxID=78828 RepID=UPI0009E43EF0|nr:uncharacterized protein LOC110019427 isoform X2 [Phalaenopsis equestris]